MEREGVMPDERIVELYWQRDESAIRQTADAYGDYCHYIAYNILHNREDAEESVNDTWLDAWAGLIPAGSSFSRTSCLGNWWDRWVSQECFAPTFCAVSIASSSEKWDM